MIESAFRRITSLLFLESSRKKGIPNYSQGVHPSGVRGGKGMDSYFN